MSRQQQNINTLVGKSKDGDYYWLNYVFEESADFRGATGSVFRPVSEAEKEEKMDFDNAKDWLKEIWQGAVSTGNTEQGLDGYVQEVIDIDGENAFFDLSCYDNGCEIAEMFNSELPENADESEKAEFSECVGGGRCFNHKIEWDKIYDNDALTLALSYEAD